MKQYMLSVHHDGTFDPSAISEEDIQATYAAVEAFNAEVQAADAWVFAGGLTLPDSATTVRHADGQTMVTDGPYAETKEFLGGFWVIKAEDLDAALAWARKGAVACRGDVEVRPFQDDAE